jgi:hypothetical protein
MPVQEVEALIKDFMSVNRPMIVFDVNREPKKSFGPPIQAHPPSRRELPGDQPASGPFAARRAICTQILETGRAARED